MIFTTGIFALFLALSLAAYWLAPLVLRRYVMIGAGFVFYAYYFPKYLLLIGGLALVTYVIARVILKIMAADDKSLVEVDAGQPEHLDGSMEKGHRPPAPQLRLRLWLALGITLSVLVLGFFKYWKMILGTVNSLSAYLDWGVNIPIPYILVPLGISFFTFEFIHFLGDIYTGKIKPATVNAVDFALFTFFYPTLVCGPIKRYQEFHQQRVAGITFNSERFFLGGRRVVVGLAKKFIIADTVGRLAACLATPATTAPEMLILGMYAYAIKIYYDFAGYSDLAIGISLMFGYRVPENFNRPYLQPNIALFWRNWHMSLSSWIRDYLYIPLGGSRRGLPRTLANLVVAFTLCGLWHGAAWNFVAWGAWHGLGLAGYRLWQRFKGNAFTSTGPVTRVVSTLITFHFVTLGWILFASPNLATALVTFKKIAAIF